MTDRELDRMMQHVLLDAIKRDCEKETDDVPAFNGNAGGHGHCGRMWRKRPL